MVGMGKSLQMQSDLLLLRGKKASLVELFHKGFLVPKECSKLLLLYSPPRKNYW